jgi:hypothetical protein
VEHLAVIANRILSVILTVLAFAVIPIQVVTTLLLGLLVSIPLLGLLLLLCINLVWTILLAPMLGLSRLCHRIEPLRIPISLFGIPLAIMADTYVCLMPSMGEFESRAAKLMLAESWPYSWDFWQFQCGRLDLDSPDGEQLREVLARVSHRDPLRQRTIDRLMRHEPLDSQI